SSSIGGSRIQCHESLCRPPICKTQEASLHRWPHTLSEVWTLIHVLSKTVIDCGSESEEPMPSSSTFILKSQTDLLDIIIVQLKTTTAYTTSTRSLHYCLATIKSHSHHRYKTIEFEPPFRSVSVSQSFRKTNATSLHQPLISKTQESNLHHQPHTLPYSSSIGGSRIQCHESLCRPPICKTQEASLHRWPHTLSEVWTLIHVLSKTVIDYGSESEEPMPSSSTFILKRFDFASIFENKIC
ncbi:hypothetical protein CFP56_042492, partial [Quercus suber]